MPFASLNRRFALHSLLAAVVIAALAAPAAAFSAPSRPQQPPQPQRGPQPGTLRQLPGARRLPGRPAPSPPAAAAPRGRCRARARSWARARSRSAPTAATSTSPPRAATRSRSSGATRSTGALTQPKGTAGCIAAKGAGGCAHGGRARRPELGRGQPRRPQRLRDLARQQRDHRLPPQPQDRRAAPAPRQRRLHLRRCRSPAAPAAGRCSAPTWSSSAPTARNVYVGSFFGNAVAVFARNRDHRRADPAGRQRRLHRRSEQRRLRDRHRPRRPRGDGDQRATAPTSTSPPRSPTRLAVLARDPSTGALTQATDGSGCIVDSAAHRLHHRRGARAAPTRSRSAPATTTST